ncbi:phage portal protein [Oceanibaculum indicum]|uniref:Phage portal protein, HK97 n=1 Tax=Oceanibaculum indicum P24 TaxID=1207063 RepID=K2JU70_9PROT|nr:phage portal protein [Oceanibaculum indicum]EKE68700.1 Phage portal protein, HK97 [Oceanibaculum indicum P24]
MALTSWLRAALGMAPKATAQRFDLTNMSPEDMRDFLRIGGSMATTSGVSVTESSTMRVAAAWRCTQIICGAVSWMPLDLVIRESEKVRRPAVGHPLRHVLTVRPNTWQTPKEFRQMMQAQMLLRGNGYARKVMAGSRLVGLIPLHPDRVRPEQMSDMSIRYHVTRPDGQSLTLTQADMLHLRGLSLDGWRGLSVMSCMREALGLSIQAEHVAARLFKDGTLAGGVFTHPSTLTEPAYNRLRDSLAEKHGGAENAHKYMILEEGMKAEALAMSAEDAQFLQTRDFQRYDIAMFFGVPPHLIGATEKSTSWGSGIEQQNIGFVTYTLADWLRTWEESIKRDLMSASEAETMDARFSTAGLLRGDVKNRWGAYVQALQWGVYSPDEVRALEDENPRADGAGGVYYDPPNTAGLPSGTAAGDRQHDHEEDRVQ